jgi:hypothetical protein
MSEYEVGYGRPPRSSRFKPGKSGNPKGRPKRQSRCLADIIDAVMSAAITYRVNGRAKSASREEVMLKALIDKAMQGDIGAADHLLKVYADACKFGDLGVSSIQVENWLPDHDGQTAGQKSQASLESQNTADPIEWWNDPEQSQRSE